MRSPSIVGGTGIFLETSEHDELRPALDQAAAVIELMKRTFSERTHSPVEDGLLGSLRGGDGSDREPGDVVVRHRGGDIKDEGCHLVMRTGTGAAAAWLLGLRRVTGATVVVAAGGSG